MSRNMSALVEEMEISYDVSTRHSEAMDKVSNNMGLISAEIRGLSVMVAHARSDSKDSSASLMREIQTLMHETCAASIKIAEGASSTNATDFVRQQKEGLKKASEVVRKEQRPLQHLLRLDKLSL
eukprot:GHVP01002271.1.p1 GENE.GHVP01002271.1~~GHVP01002271.1.p1  ORF type:complete len:125 (+),score=9.52 GHVP01002271.1:246-620(+)